MFGSRVVAPLATFHGKEMECTCSPLIIPGVA